MSSKVVTFKAETADEEQRIVWAEVYAPNIPDADCEFMDAVTIRKMAYDFMQSLKLTSVDTNHDNVLVDGCCVVESFIARKGDPDFIEGAWVVGMHIDSDDAWEKVKKGEINGFSIEAAVCKTPMEVEVEIPPIINGPTMKSEGHSHTFYVTYDEHAKFRGGRTDVVDGHSHLITRGTCTAETNGHTHRFSHVEGLTLKE